MSIKKLVLFFIFLFKLGSTANAIDPVLDSLKSVLKKCPDDTNKLKILENMADIAPDGEWQKYSEQLGRLAQKFMKNDHKAIQLAGLRYYSVSLNNMAYEYAEKGDFQTALDYYEKCIKIDREIKDDKNMGLVLSSVGAIYDRQNDLENAVKIYKQALETEIRVNNKKDLVATYTNIGTLYTKKNMPDSALHYYLKAMNIADQNKFQDHNVTILLADIGNNMLEKGNDEKALEYYTRGLKISEETGDKSGETANLNGVSKVLFKQAKINDALKFAQKALSISLEHGYPKEIIGASQTLKRIYFNQNNFKEAYKMYQLEIANRDSMERKENQKAVIRHQFQYEYDMKEATKKLEQENRDIIASKELQEQKLIRNGFIGGFIFVLVFAVVVLTQRNKIKIGKKQSDELLLNILPAEVTNELKERGKSTAKHFDEVTVMFTDFVEFTKIGEKLSPQVLVQELHECFSAFDEIIERNGLEKIKTVGDAYIAVCGLPISNTQHALKTVKAAKEILQFMEERKRQEKVFEIRIGVHSGPVVAGIVGVKKFAYDIWGDTVNTASRMESSGEAGKINISETTYALVKDQFNCSHRGKISAKGKGEIDMYFVTI